MKFSKVRTRKKKSLEDITDLISEVVLNSDNSSGAILIFVQHTTCSIALIDNDPGIEDDFFNAVSKIMPDLNYIHPHNPKHLPDHVLSSLIGHSLIVPFKDKQLQLGTWQRIYLVELDGPRERNFSISIVAEL